MILILHLNFSDPSPWVSSLSKDKEAPTIEKLDNYSRIVWERVIRVMTGNEEALTNAPKDIINLLSHAHLMYVHNS